MKFCSKCGSQCEDFAAACPACGNAFATASAPVAPAQAPMAAQAPMGAPVQAPVMTQAPMMAAPVMVAANPSDHTHEFDAKDISDNKVYAMLCYIFGLMGVIVAAICAKESPYVKFHMTWALRSSIILVLSYLLMIVPFLGWIAAPICMIIVLVLQIIAFFQVCGGKAKEMAIIRSFGFLK